MTGWRTIWTTLSRNPVSTFAVLFVAATAAFLGYMAVWQTKVLTSPAWCDKILGAEKAAPGKTLEQGNQALTSCVDVLKIQLNAVATDSHINQGSFALVLLVLIVVVIARARATFKASMSGIEGSVSSASDVAAAAEHVVAGAETAAAEVKEEAKVEPTE